MKDSPIVITEILHKVYDYLKPVHIDFVKLEMRTLTQYY